MGTIHKYIPTELLFDPDTLAAMGNAYDRAIRSFPTAPEQSVREVIATQIIFLARSGLRDPVQLCQQALAAYGFKASALEVMTALGQSRHLRHSGMSGPPRNQT